MRSSSGAHFIALDHVRAVPIFMVFAWHFTHARNGYPVPFDYVPALFPFSVLDEGHTGVALFMSLSGYLFAKLLDGKSIDYRRFLLDRALRLLPPLAVGLLKVGLAQLSNGDTPLVYFLTIVVLLHSQAHPQLGWPVYRVVTY